jgi:RHS repeat-associated protein
VNITVKSGVAQIYYVYTDHLNTPRLIQDQNRKAVWRWEQTEPFGDSRPNEDPENSGTSFTCNLRFPGQYFDSESGAAYNYAREYFAEVGRYLQSDPIGLGNGMNTFNYPLMPLDVVDPAGLMGARGGGKSPNAPPVFAPAFVALAVFVPVFPLAQYEGTSTCGAEGGVTFPNEFDGISIQNVCQRHDECYDKCCGVSKEACDLRWLDDIKHNCGYQPRCLLAGYFYYRAFKRFGTDPFLDGRANCRSGKCFDTKGKCPLDK